MCTYIHTQQVPKDNTGCQAIHYVIALQPTTICNLLGDDTYLLPECTNCLVLVQQFLFSLYEPQLLLYQLSPAPRLLVRLKA